MRLFRIALALILIAPTAAAAHHVSINPGRTIYTSRSWECNGSLRRYGRLPIKVVSEISNPGRADAIKLVGCYGDGDPRTVDLILAVRGNGRRHGTGYDAVKIGRGAHDLVVTGHANCGRPAGGAHQDGVQVMSGRRIKFVSFRSGNPLRDRWTCWGAGGGWFVSHAIGSVPRRVVCVRCRIASYNQAMRIEESVRSGAKRSVFGFSRAHGIVLEGVAVRPVNVHNRVVRY